MQQFIDSIYAARAAKGAGSKKVIAAAISGWSDVGKRLVREAMDPYRVFNVNKVEMPDRYASKDTVADVFFRLLDRLHERDISGHEAKAEITHTLSLYTERTATILMAVLRKDLKAGFSDETVNEIYCGTSKPLPMSSALIPYYACMLAAPTPKDPKTRKNLPLDRLLTSFPYLMEKKYDGQRNQAAVDYGLRFNYLDRIIHRARSGKRSDHLAGLFDEELFALESYMHQPMLIDSEAMGDSFADTISAKGSDSDGLKSKLKLVVYDMMPLEHWNRMSCPIPQMERTEIIRDAIKTLGLELLVPAEGKLVHNIDEVLEYYGELVDAGEEGAVVKNPKGLYVWDRHQDWQKLKPTETYDAKIVGFYAGKEHGKYAKTLGGLYVEGVHDGVPFTCKVGGGFKEKDEPNRPSRDTIWNNQSEYLGQWIEIEADPNLTLARGKDVCALRWGQFVKLRTDRNLTPGK